MKCPDCKEVRGKFVMCPQHEAEWRETHERWHAEHRAENAARSAPEPQTAADLL